MSPSALPQLSARLRSPARLYGTLIVSPSPHWVPVVAGLGLDFVFIDTEHIPLDREKLAWMCQAYRAVGLPPIVRIMSPDPFQACAVLDGGAAGIVAPYVETAAQVRELVGAAKKRPLKGQVLARHLAGEPLDPALAGYVQAGATARTLIVNIESVPALEALDEILAVEGLDGVLIGPHDLSSSLGVPERYDHPAFIAACDTIIAKARARSLGAGIHVIYQANRLADEERWARLGANFILHAADIILFSEGTIVARCRFDGEKLTYVEHGSEFTIPRERGLYEPSIAAFGGRYYLTMRADHSAFAARSDDGLHFAPFVEWTFDDGKVLGSYNTQQHWLTHNDTLYLIYTRRGANNDHVMRHRAPLFIAEVDPARLCVRRATERILIPESNADIGAGFGVLAVSPRETWVITSEIPTKGSRDYNRVLLARVTWQEPNRFFTGSAAK